MNKFVASTFVSLITILTLNGCCGPTSYAFDNVLLSTSRDEKTLKVIDPVTTFSSDVPVIYGQTLFTNPTEGETTYIVVNFSKINNNGESEIVDTSTKTTKQAGLMVFDGKRPGFSWPTGTYVIDFVVNDTIYASQEFEIVSTQTGVTSEKSKWISNTQTTKTVDSAHNPTSPTSTFSSNSEEIYLSIEANELMQKNTTIKVEWRYLDDTQLVIEQTQTIGKNQKIHFTFDRAHNKNFLETNSDWKSGSYEAKIYLDNVFIKQVLFTIN